MRRLMMKLYLKTVEYGKDVLHDNKVVVDIEYTDDPRHSH